MRPPRLRGFSYIGKHRYSLTLNTSEGCEHFTNADLVSLVRAQFLRFAKEFRFEIPAYCFNRDHLHLLAHGADGGSDLKKFVSKAKQHSAFVARHQIRGRLWQPGYWDCVLNAHDESAIVARYVLLNRIHAGLATSVIDDPFVGSETMSTEELLRFVGQVSP